MTKHSSAARSQFRALLAGDRCVNFASVYDPISSRIAADLGYEAALMGGSLVSHVVLGAPDLILLTLTELATQVERSAQASQVPILVDADHGYGNALNVTRTVAALDHAGAAALTIEDTDLPRPYGPSGAARLLPLEESVGKIRAAVRARGESDLVILGRTSAASTTSLEDAITRFQAYEKAGVDALFIPALSSRSALERISQATRLPLIVGGASGEVADPSLLASQRVRAWSGGHQVFAVAINALYQAMGAVLQGTAPSRLPGIAPAALMNKLLDTAHYEMLTREFLGGRDASGG
jgi:carboxyvinyl-carboxyphosphonate phosphorylmutase